MLKPCPFCGSDVTITEACIIDTYYIDCKCGCVVGLHDIDEEGFTTGKFNTVSEATEAWNKRACEND